MPLIRYQGQAFPGEKNETVLDTLRRNGIAVPFSCCAGACHSCLLHCLEGKPGERAQRDLKPAMRNLNYFLACQCVPQQDMEVALPNSADVYVQARLVEKEALAPDVWCLRLDTDTPVQYHAGQFLNLKNEAGWLRSYSLASLPGEDTLLELHVRRMPAGRMSSWLIDEFEPGMHVEIEGPNGHCIYSNDEPEKPLLMIGTGTGLAPLYGILRDALRQDHQGRIDLYHGVRNGADLYLHDTLLDLAARHTRLNYHPCVSGETPGDGILTGRASELALASHPDLKDWQLYLCGAPEMVRQTRKLAFLAGARMQDISADAFTASSPAPATLSGAQ